jgi:RHS repeat-associated protein
MGTTTFVWDPVFDCVTHELDENNDVKAVYHNEPQQYGAVLSQRRGTTSHFHHHDALGSTRFLTDSSGNVSDTYLHDAWGNEVASTGTTMNPFKWVGKYGYYTDDSTGQVYVRARMYQPILAVWRSQDPLSLTDGTNLFRAVRNSAASHVDPSGLLTWTTTQIENIPLWGSRSGFAIPEGGLYALKGKCGSFAWKINWDPWENFEEISDPPRRGYIVQKVCVDATWENCPNSNPEPNTFPPIPNGNQMALEQCPGNCYFELWRVHDGKIYAGPLSGRIGSTAEQEPTDLFAFLGHSNGCTKGRYEQTGYSFFVWKNAIWDRLLDKFKRGPRGIRNAGKLYSACATPELEADLLRAYEWTPPGAELGDPQIPLGTKRRVKSVWDCCGGDCSGEVCNTDNPLNEIEFEPFPNSRGAT